MTIMNVLVTGGAGFIGSNFILYWMRQHPEDRIVCLDKLTYAGNLSSLATVRGTQRVEFIQGDICDEAVVQDIFAEKGPDVVVNFAAESHAVCGRPLPGPGFDPAWRPCRGSLQCRRRQ